MAVKRARLQEIFEGAVPAELLEALEVVPSEPPWRYRNKMEFTFKPADDESSKVLLGLHQFGAYDKLVDLEMCHICHEGSTPILDDVRAFATKSGLFAYNSDTCQGFWRFLQVRSSKHTGDLLVDIFTRGDAEEPVRTLARELAARHPALKSVWWSLTPGKADAALAQSSRLMVGAPFILERIGGIDVEVGPRTFMQPNVPLASRLYADLAEALHLDGTGVLWDLYCGSGSIGLSLAERVQAVFGIERSVENVIGARKAALRNHIQNFRITRGNLEKIFRGRRLQVPEGFERPEFVVTDPPRAGLHRRVLNRVVDLGARRWAYIACRPESLKRDLIQLMAMRAPYRVDWIRAYDFFPHTLHVETMVGLSRVDAGQK